MQSRQPKGSAIELGLGSLSNKDNKGKKKFNYMYSQEETERLRDYGVNRDSVADEMDPRIVNDEADSLFSSLGRQ